MSSENPILKTHKNSGNEAAVIFIHGFGGTPQETWGNFPDIIAGGRPLDKWDVFSLGYSTRLRIDLAGIWSADPDLKTLAKYLKTRCGLSPLDEYKALAIVAHSMGGLVVQRAMLDHEEFAARVTYVFLFGTPSAGLMKARLFQRLKRQFRDMTSDGEFIKELRSEWKQKYGDSSEGSRKFKMWVTAGDRDEFVPASSSLEAFPPESFPGVTLSVVPGNHLQIVKPVDKNDNSVQLVIKALKGGAATAGPWNSAAVAVESRDFHRAVEILEPNKDQLDSAALVQLALALEGTGRREDALQVLKKARDGSSTDAMGVLAGRLKRRWLAERRDLDAREARALYAKALAMSEAEGNAEQAFYHGINVAFMDLAYIENRTEAKRKARDMALKVLTHCQGCADTYWRLATEGEARLMLGETDLALESYRKALSLGPKPREIESMYQQALKVADLLDNMAAAEALDTIFGRSDRV